MDVCAFLRRYRPYLRDRAAAFDFTARLVRQITTFVFTGHITALTVARLRPGIRAFRIAARNLNLLVRAHVALSRRLVVRDPRRKLGLLIVLFLAAVVERGDGTCDAFVGPRLVPYPPCA